MEKSAPTQQSDKTIGSRRSRMGKIVIIVSAIWLVINTVYASHRTSSLQLWAMLATLVFFAAILGGVILVFTGWHNVVGAR
jgi:heme A synthase